MTRIKFNSLIPALLIIGLWCCKDSTDQSMADELPVSDSIVAEVNFFAISPTSDSTFEKHDSHPHGSAIFLQEDSTVSLTISLKNFPPNSVHAVHIHNGSCEQPGMNWNQGQPTAYVRKILQYQ